MHACFARWRFISNKLSVSHNVTVDTLRCGAPVISTNAAAGSRDGYVRERALLSKMAGSVIEHHFSFLKATYFIIQA